MASEALLSREYSDWTQVSLVKIHVWSPNFAGFGGGIASFSRELVVGLRDNGHGLRLYGKLDSTGIFEGVPLSGAMLYPTLLRNACFAATALASCAKHRPEHIITTHLNFGPIARLAKRVVGTPYTVVAHGIDVHSALDASKIRALRDADRVITVSAWTKARVLRLGGIDASRVAIVANTLDDSRFSVRPEPESLKRRYGIRPDERVVLIVARLSATERYKGYDTVVHALPTIRSFRHPVRFLVVGDGDDRQRVEALAVRLGVEKLVTFAGFVEAEELPDHYRLADAFAMPSSGEGFGIVFLEAMACGTPVLAGNCDGSVDALDGGRLGLLVDPKDVGSIARGIVALLGKDGPPLWFDRNALHEAVVERFGRAVFRAALERTFS